MTTTNHTIGEDAANGAMLPAWFDTFLINVCEIPDRNSPEDEPEAIVATLEELKSCALNAIEQCSAANVAMGERGAFEAWARTDEGNCADYDLARKTAPWTDEYRNDLVQRDWEIWQARAASPQPVQTERALTDTELEKLYWTAMNNAADILGYMEEARALLLAAQPASSLAEGGE